MQPGDSESEALRRDPANWRLGIIYVCKDDPRIVVPNRYWLGWTWNFAHRWVLPAILVTVAIAVGPLLIAWWSGVRATGTLLLIFFLGLVAAILFGVRLSQVAFGAGRG